MNKKYYFSVLIQDSDIINEIDNLIDKECEEDGFNACAQVADMYECFDENIDNFTDYEPYIGKGSDLIQSTYKNYVLMVNNSLGGIYMLYRPATEQENEWLNDRLN